MHLAKRGEQDITEALDEYIAEARMALASMAPKKEVLDVLWIKYDYHNLKTIIKSKRAGLDEESIKALCFAGGKHSPDTLIKAYEDGTLARLNNHFADAAEKARSASHIFEIDLAMNEHYFKTIKNIALTSKDAFVKDFVILQIDLFNVKAALRAELLQNVDPKTVYISGGTFRRKDLEKRKDILESLRRIGNEKDWADAITQFEKTGDYTHLEKASDEHTINFLRSRSTQVFSPAPIFSYFTLLKNNAQTIGAVIVAKRSGVPEKELRTILRRVYV
jgi:V/A-type H+-transporting ATPase subunit C